MWKRNRHNGSCKGGGFLACKCGDFGSKKANTVAYGPAGYLLSPSDKDRAKPGEQASAGIKGAGDFVYNAGKATPEETQQYTGSFDIGKLLKQIFSSQLGIGNAPEGYKDDTQQYLEDPLNQALYNQVLPQAQDPDKYFQDTLQPELQQAQDTINSYYQKRGLLNSGLAIEGMGRAGVDLAIKQAQARMQSRQQSLQNAQTLSQNINVAGQNRIANLANLYSSQQQFGQSALNRQAGQGQAAGQYYAYPYQAQLGSYYGGIAAQQALPGQVIGAAGKIAAAAI